MPMQMNDNTARNGVEVEVSAIEPITADEILAALRYRVGKNESVATGHDWLDATAKVIRDRLIDRWIASTKQSYERGDKRVYYLSLEFLIGRLLRDAIGNLGLAESIRSSLASLGVELDAIAALEPDAALGNGGLGLTDGAFDRELAALAELAAAIGSAINQFEGGAGRQCDQQTQPQQRSDQRVTARCVGGH